MVSTRYFLSSILTLVELEVAGREDLFSHHFELWIYVAMTSDLLTREEGHKVL
jgi:hypothetical protein